MAVDTQLLGKILRGGAAATAKDIKQGIKNVPLLSQLFQVAGAASVPEGVQLNPMQEGILKKVIKVQGDKVEEAMQQGASGEQVLKDAGISISSTQPKDKEGKPEGTSLALAGVQPSVNNFSLSPFCSGSCPVSFCNNAICSSVLPPIANIPPSWILPSGVKP